MAVPPRPPAFELSSQDTNDSSETAHPPVKLPLKRKAPAEMDEHISELPSVAAQLSFDVHAKQALHETTGAFACCSFGLRVRTLAWCTATFGNIVADEEDAYGADIIKASEAFVAVLGTQAEPLVNDLLRVLSHLTRYNSSHRSPSAHIKRGQEHHANKTEEFAKSDEDMRKDLEKDNVRFITSLCARSRPMRSTAPSCRRSS